MAKSAKQKKTNDDSSVIRFVKRKRLLATLLGLFSVLLTLSLVSYTKVDEANAQLSLVDFYNLLNGDKIVEIKAMTTQNWLGLLGAYISNIIYNNTLGYGSIILPLITFYWAKSLFFELTLSRKAIRNTTALFAGIIFFSAFMGSLHYTNYFANIPKEWSGAVGSFLASICTNFIGSLGTSITFATLFLVTMIFGTDLKIDEGFSKLSNYINSMISNYKEKRENEKNEEIIEYVTTEEEIEEEIETPSDNISESIEEKSKSFVASAVVPAHVTVVEKSFESRFVEDNLEVDHSHFNKLQESNRSFLNNARPLGQATTIKKGISITFNKNPTAISSFDKNYESKEVEEQDLNSIYEKEAEKFVQEIVSKENKNIPAPMAPIVESFPSEALDIESLIEFEELDVIEEYLEDDEIKNVGSTPLPAEEIPQELAASKSNFDLSYLKDVPSKETELVYENETDDFSKMLEEIETSLSTPKVEAVPKEQVKSVLLQAMNEENSDEKLNISINNSFIELQSNQVQSFQKEETKNSFLNIFDEKIDYTPPHVGLLNKEKEMIVADESELKANAEILQNKLEQFKISISDIRITPGPVVTQYEFVPDDGIKISKIEGLADDLTMALKAKGIRIIAPVPGRGTVGVEIPNAKASLVSFSSIVNSEEFQKSKFKLPLALGKNVSGSTYIADLATMPHLLIAGATGAGKSVGINSIITSLLYQKKPDELKFIIIDPKKVEMSQYAKLSKHFLASSPDVKEKIITNPIEAVLILKSAVQEMEDRYTLLAEMGVRNLSEYNQKIDDGKIVANTKLEHRKLPYIVAVVDELADLMMTSGKEIEEPIIMLAQKARAIGIHVILATQRPSVNVITGLIKANFPSRIAFRVAQKVDSRTILDGNGAEQLLGNGDMLYLAVGMQKAERIQNAYLSTEEVDNVTDFIGNQKGYSQPYMLPSVVEARNDSDDYDTSDRDDLFEDAARLVIRSGSGSTSSIQRRMKIGFARAGRIMDQLEMAGVVGPGYGSKPREVLMDSESELERIL